MLTNLLHKLHTQVELIGMDIGTASVKLVRLLKGADGYTVSVVIKEEIDTGAINAENRYELIAAAVKECLRKANLNSPNIVCGVSGPEVVVRGFKFPPLPDAAIEQAVRLEAQQVCPFDPKHTVLDYQLIENMETTDAQKAAKVFPRSGVMVACTESVIKEKTAMLAEAEAKVLLVDSDALGLLNCLNELNMLETSTAAAVIDIGWEFTNVIIYGQDGLPFVRDLNNAGKQIVQKISEELHLPGNEVRHILAGQEAPAEMRDKFLLVLNKAVRPLASAIHETLRFYSIQEKNSGVEKIFLCGGFSLAEAFVKFFSDALPVEVRRLNPFEKMKCQPTDRGQEWFKTGGPEFAVAAGLAMRTI